LEALHTRFESAWQPDDLHVSLIDEITEIVLKPGGGLLSAI